MSALIILGLIFGLGLLLQMLFRVKPLYVFVSIIVGNIWVEYLGEPAELILRSIVHFDQPGAVARIGLLLIPVILTIVLIRKSLATHTLPLQLYLIVANSLLLGVIIISLLPNGVQNDINATSVGKILRQANDVIIAGVAGLHILVMWLMRSKLVGIPNKRKKH